MLHLYQFGPAWGMPDPSPFVAKVIAYLRLANIPFETTAGMGNLRQSPKGKLPFIDDDGTVVADSGFIIPYLQNKYDQPVAEPEGSREIAALRGLTRMIDEDLYFALVYARWIDPDNWNEFTRPNFFGRMSWPMSALVPALVQRGVRKSLHHQGIGRHEPSEIMAIGLRNLEAIRDYLGNRQFIAGETVTVPDATVYAFLNTIATPPHRSEFKDFVHAQPSLMGYLARMDAELEKSQARVAAEMSPSSRPGS